MLTTHRRVATRGAIAMAATAALTLMSVTTASAHGDHGKDKERAEKAQAEYSSGLNVPLVNSPNVNLVASNPGSAGISGCFTQSAPLFVMSSLDSIKVFDVSDPLNPSLTGTMPSAQFENEAMNCGERRSESKSKGKSTVTSRFSLIGVDLYQANPADIQHVNVRPVDGYELIVVDVTDPANPHVRSRATSTTSTHTVNCIAETDCQYAYTAGNSKQKFSIIDLTDLDNPVEVDSDPATPGTQPFSSPTAGHKWNFDTAGFATNTGYNGSSMFDVRDPRSPRLVTTTGLAGQGKNPDGSANGYNDFIHHNSFRPNADAFKQDKAPSFANGNVLLVTEEDYEQTDCSQAGSFQAWHVKRLDGTPDAIVPLDKVELSDLGTFPLPQGAFCSAHWFSYNPAGIVAIGYYGGGTQLIDVRDPQHLKSYGYAVWGASEVWDAYWMPVYDTNGRDTGQKTNLVYSVDLVRGLDVYAVDLPGGTQLTSGVGVGGIALGSTAGPLGALTPPWDSVAIGTMLLIGLGGYLVRRRHATERV
ncbi:MAG: hypothetical protein M3Z83_00720 [Actinomycetota bacterium]|nr:hypothetical protein [Actinomycetota bacterium]